MVYHLEVSFKVIGFSTEILDILWKENFIRGYSITSEDYVRVFLRYYQGSPVCTQLTVISSSHHRLYFSLLDLSRLADDFGVLIISTPKGIMTADNAVRIGEGGEVLAYIA